MGCSRLAKLPFIRLIYAKALDLYFPPYMLFNQPKRQTHYQKGNSPDCSPQIFSTNFLASCRHFDYEGEDDIPVNRGTPAYEFVVRTISTLGAAHLLLGVTRFIITD